jgi:hypothetical protein
MPVGVNRRRHDDRLSGRPFDGEAARVDLGTHPLDDHTTDEIIAQPLAWRFGNGRGFGRGAAGLS